MREIVFAVPGDLDTPTGGYRYDRAVIGALRAAGHRVTHLELPGSFPDPGPADRAAALEALAAVPPSAALIVDGLAYSVLPADELAGLAAPLIALIHHPLALETGLPAATAARLEASERAALTEAAAVVVTSAPTAATLCERFGVEESRITVAVPGLDARWRRIAPAPVAPPMIVSVGSVSPRKGHDVLVEALRRIADLPFTCEIVGSLTHDTGCADALREMIERSGLGGRVTLHGALPEERIAALYAKASVFALATRYEGFGMVFVEAMAAGLAVVGTTGGAVPSVVPEGAGRLVAPDDPQAFAHALRALLTDEALRADCAAAARQAGAGFSGWDETARIIAGVAERVA